MNNTTANHRSGSMNTANGFTRGSIIDYHGYKHRSNPNSVLAATLISKAEKNNHPTDGIISTPQAIRCDRCHTRQSKSNSFCKNCGKQLLDNLRNDSSQSSPNLNVKHERTKQSFAYSLQSTPITSTKNIRSESNCYGFNTSKLTEEVTANMLIKVLIYFTFFIAYES